MPIKYNFRKNPLNKESDKSGLYPCVVSKGTRRLEDIVEEVKNRTTFSSGELHGALTEVFSYIAESLSDGYNVRIERLGGLSLSLSSPPVKEKSEKRAASICVRDVNFRCAPELLRDLRRRSSFERAKGDFKASSDAHSKAERLELLKGYLSQHPSITCTEYMKLSRCLHSFAHRELDGWVKKGELRKLGRYGSACYVLPGSVAETGE